MSGKLTFEKALEELEVIIKRLEEGDIPLEEALEIYQKGMELSKTCHDKLKYAEEKLTKVLTENGEEEFHVSEEDQA
ncbi:MAG TPA: exodeoxyribonuclease VII small subunit [Bacillus bacterium]|uniref:Exodeoxyribonuclease 7 small subunit n=1 Tax=Siminovitchia fordii TaxID=254759 RepID=A0ABQ4K448_9BACI|nr:exodeoxyribonuclease VII small subunit [Siminovitchia fordii]GIN19950.1 exodeoxyribonuclease 7 small subunit [Siminovitchia fordii]HBZ08566.1 exodeoxyribonuclease VII small subunit [Bacillus sp. (in: firmicutes)]